MINSVLHETIVRDIVDFFRDTDETLDDLKKAAGNVKSTNYSSIARASSDLVLVFPYMCDSTVSIQTAGMMSKAIERQCTSMIRMLFSALQLSDADNAMAFLRRFHKNISSLDLGDVSIDDVLTLADDLAESAGVEVKDPGTYHRITEEMSRMFYEASMAESISEGSMMDFSVIERGGELHVLAEGKGSRGKTWHQQKETKNKNKAKDKAKAADPWGVDPADIDFDPNPFDYEYGGSTDYSSGARNSYYARGKGAKVISVNTHKGGSGASSGSGVGTNPSASSNRVNRSIPLRTTGATASKKTAAEKIKDPIEARKLDPKDYAQWLKAMLDAESNRLIDSDVKKANEMMPTMMNVEFIGTNANGDSIPMTFVCGIKCRLVPVDPMDIADHILTKHQDKNVLLSFIRATTRETRFIRDFLFAIDKAKIDALSNSRRGSANKMWKVLERRAIKSRYRRVFSDTNDAARITTLGISRELAEYIKKENNIDMDNARVARQMMEGYNLMGMQIIDEATESVKVMWDTGEGMYETITFSNLEREGNGGEYKKALNLMQKMYR